MFSWLGKKPESVGSKAASNEPSSEPEKVPDTRSEYQRQLDARTAKWMKEKQEFQWQIIQAKAAQGDAGARYLVWRRQYEEAGQEDNK